MMFRGKKVTLREKNFFACPATPRARYRGAKVNLSGFWAKKGLKWPKMAKNGKNPPRLAPKRGLVGSNPVQTDSN